MMIGKRAWVHWLHAQPETQSHMHICGKMVMRRDASGIP